MAVKLFVGNLETTTSAETIGRMFETIGIVKSATIATRGETSRGFGFVEMENDEVAQRAVRELNGRILDGREIRVEISHLGTRPRFQRGPRRFGRSNNFFRQPRFNSYNNPRQRTYPSARPERDDAPIQRFAPARQYAPREPRTFIQRPPYQPRQQQWAEPNSYYEQPYRPRPRFFRPRIRRTFRDRNTSGRKGPESKTRVYISNLPYQLSSEELKSQLSAFKVKEVLLPKRRYNTSLNVGYGFVELETEAEQQRLVHDSSEIKILNRTCRVAPAHDQIPRDNALLDGALKQ
ncbi:MAG: hypothetical protein EZS28_017977 [Streblomastix strix]|uniref:RRM domain-containing protein n=1 Tax=Streblomastix strix TaxID=222440 RepID=A0A5J4VWE4_9EUKA|nr:MAG: hypothetical protein EZS28_017977 [Streblomastix strix]